MLDTIKASLRASGLTVYDSAEKVGECRAPYVVCYDAGVEVTPKTKGMLGQQIYEVVCLVPYGDVEGLPALEKQVREILRDIPGLHQTSSAGTGIEQTFQARASALRYAIPIRLY